jgi:LmeA-like phospholipid-binding
VIVVAVLLVVADRVAVVVAERQIAQKVQSSQELSHRPSVSIEGFPFLTQVLANHYPTVKLAAQNLTVGSSDRRVRLAELHARLHDVRTIDRFSGATAQTADGTAMLSYRDLSKALGVTLGYAGGGRVQASSSVKVLNQTITGTASANVGVAGGDELTFSSIRVGVPQAGISVPEQVTRQFSSAFENKLSLRGLPFHLRIQQLVATEDGVRISATARDLTLS